LTAAWHHWLQWNKVQARCLCNPFIGCTATVFIFYLHVYIGKLNQIIITNTVALYKS